jgi:large subunit ribosomal protein L10
MAITKDKKRQILDTLSGISAKSSVVFVNFHGLPVDETSAMRAKLREQDVSYYVAKKTLAKKAFVESGIEGEMPVLEGELAIAYSDEPTAAAREIYSFQKEYDGAVRIMGGVFDQRFLSESEMTEIAQIPGIDTLRGMFVNVINAPIQGLAVALQAIADKKEA